MRPDRIAIPGKASDVQAYVRVLCGLGARVQVEEAAFSHEAYDGLVIPGGEDIDPARYGQENTGCRIIDRKMDALQFGAAEEFLKAGKPILGICNGMQMLNICFGGDLIQDIETKERHQRNQGEDSFHRTRARKGSWLYSLYGSSFRVNSAHHQAVGRLGTGLEAVQWSEEDEVVEGIRHLSLPVIGVQWHPERLVGPGKDGVDGTAVYRFFLEMTRRLREKRSNENDF